MARLHIYKEYCKGCEICIEFCPHKVLEKTNEFNERGYLFPRAKDPKKCTGCKICELLCPDYAIVVEA